MSMRIQNVDMAVPVGRPAMAAADNIQAELSTEMEALRQRCAHAIRQRCGRAWTAQQRTSRSNQFEVELKGIVKKLASTACSDISDRDARARMRISLYTDLSAIAQTICSEIDASHLRGRRRFRWLGGALLLAALCVSAAVWIAPALTL
jgi:hypothetical protein